jgi:hypothetical protein
MRGGIAGSQVQVASILMMDFGPALSGTESDPSNFPAFSEKG